MRELRETKLRENFARVYGRDKETEKREGGLSPISAAVGNRHGMGTSLVHVPRSRRCCISTCV